MQKTIGGRWCIPLKKAYDDNTKCNQLSFHELLSLCICGFLFDQVVFRCGNNENLLQFIEIYSRCNISGPGQVIRIHFHFTDVSNKKSLKEPVTDMRCNNLFSDFNLIIIIGKFFKTDP